MSTQEPGQDRSNRRLPWLLSFALLLLLLMAALITWSMLRPDGGTHHASAAAAKPRLVTDPASGPVSPAPIHLHATGTGNAPTTVGSSLSVSARVVGQLSPGRVRPLVVTVNNAGTTAVLLSQVHVTVGTPADKQCDPAWFAVTGNVPQGATVSARGSRDVHLHIELRDEPVNQNACQNQNVPLAVSVDGSTAGP